MAPKERHVKHEQDMKLHIKTNQIHNEEHSAQTILTRDKKQFD